jgi:hypothetical protein
MIKENKTRKFEANMPLIFQELAKNKIRENENDYSLSFLKIKKSIWN